MKRAEAKALAAENGLAKVREAQMTQPQLRSVVELILLPRNASADWEQQACIFDIERALAKAQEAGPTLDCDQPQAAASEDPVLPHFNYEALLNSCVQIFSTALHDKQQELLMHQSYRRYRQLCMTSSRTMLAVLSMMTGVAESSNRFKGAISSWSAQRRDTVASLRLVRLGRGACATAPRVGRQIIIKLGTGSYAISCVEELNALKQRAALSA